MAITALRPTPSPSPALYNGLKMQASQRFSGLPKGLSQGVEGFFKAFKPAGNCKAIADSALSKYFSKNVMTNGLVALGLTFIPLPMIGISALAAPSYFLGSTVLDIAKGAGVGLWPWLEKVVDPVKGLKALWSLIKQNF